MFIPNGKVDRQATNLLLLKRNIHGLVILAAAVNMQRTNIQKLQIGNNIRLKSGEVGQIVKTESPLGFREFIVRRDDGTLTKVNTIRVDEVLPDDFIILPRTEVSLLAK